MNNFSISIKVENFHPVAQPKLGKHTLSNGRDLVFIDEYSPTFDLDNVCEVLGLELFPGLGKKGWEEFFSYAMSPSESRWVREQLRERGADLELVEEVRNYIFRQPKYQYASRQWSKHVVVNTYGA